MVQVLDSAMIIKSLTSLRLHPELATSGPFAYLFISKLNGSIYLLKVFVPY